MSILDLTQPQVMGILNLTPDSFSDGGKFLDKDVALRHVIAMHAAGASIIDIGGESTRPGAKKISEQEELDRVLPIIEACHSEIDITLSIDTYKPSVMQAAIKAGVCMINDVKALQEPDALQTVAQFDLPICIMHMQGEPSTMQNNPQYPDFLADILQFFQERIRVCEQAGIARERLILDPGFGFGKTVQQNLFLLKEIKQFQQFKCPILLGVSRKSTIGHVLDCDVADRLPGSLALTSLAIAGGVSIIRAHDIKATLDAVKMTQAVMQGSYNGQQ